MGAVPPLRCRRADPAHEQRHATVQDLLEHVDDGHDGASLAPLPRFSSDTAGLLRPALKEGEGRSNPPGASRCSSLLLSVSTDVRSADTSSRIAFEGGGLLECHTVV